MTAKVPRAAYTGSARMPIRWLVDHPDRLVAVTATGTLGYQELEDYLLNVEKAGAAGYRVLFDARGADVKLRRSELLAFSRVVKDRKRDDVSDGRIALIVDSDAERAMAAHFADRVDDQRPCRVFSSPEAARAWLLSKSPS